MPITRLQSRVSCPPLDRSTQCSDPAPSGFRELYTTALQHPLKHLQCLPKRSNGGGIERDVSGGRVLTYEGPDALERAARDLVSGTTLPLQLPRRVLGSPTDSQRLIQGHEPHCVTHSFSILEGGLSKTDS
jgi:hypothetical protein